MSQDRTVFRANGPFWMYAIAAPLCAAAVVGFCVTGKLEYVRVGVPIPLFLLLAGWVLLGWPRLSIGPKEVRVVNPFHTFEIPLGEITDERTKQGLTLVTTSGEVRVWAAPPPDFLALIRTKAPTGRDRRLRTSEGRVETSRLPGFAAGNAAITLEHFRLAAGKQPQRGAVVRRLNVVNVVIGAAAVVLPLVVWFL